MLKGLIPVLFAVVGFAGSASAQMPGYGAYGYYGTNGGYTPYAAYTPSYYPYAYQGAYGQQIVGSYNPGGTITMSGGAGGMYYNYGQGYVAPGQTQQFTYQYTNGAGWYVPAPGR